MDDRERPVGVGRVRIAQIRIVSSAVDPLPDRNGRDQGSIPVVRNGHHSTPASAEQSLTTGVDRHRNRILARSRRPSFPGRDELFRVDLHDLTAVDEIDVDHPVSRGLAVLRLSAERDGCDRDSPTWIDHGGGVGVAVE